MPALTRRHLLAGAAATAAVAAMPASAIAEVVTPTPLPAFARSLVPTIAAADGDYWVDKRTWLVWQMINGKWENVGMAGVEGPVGCEGGLPDA